jgi:cell division protein FtsB
MSFLFGKKKQEVDVRAERRSIAHSQRDLDREMYRLEAEEKKLFAEIHKLGKAGREVPLRPTPPPR